MHRAWLVATTAATAAAAAAGPSDLPTEPLDDRHKLILKNTGTEDLALYYLGAVSRRDTADTNFNGNEGLANVMKPGETAARYVRFDDTFVVRSRDLQWRSRVAVYEHAGSKVHPYALTFHNLMDDVPPQPVELKHANAGYVWIDPGKNVTHSTGSGHVFYVRDKGSKDRYAVSLHKLDSNDEL
mmetsp:Transcript_19916/g.60215  ORF Transcript_19916/g.60215 Transcript_19916/m.60215 type:complete len:184 (-) Transcript_19916:129-680(-)